jgi:hypothetical protein
MVLVPAQPARQVYIGALVTQMRAAQAESVKAEVEWKDRLAAFEVKFEEEQRIRARKGQVLHTEEDKVQRKAENRPLQDAFGSMDWWRARAQALATIIQAEIAYADLEEKRKQR